MDYLSWEYTSKEDKKENKQPNNTQTWTKQIAESKKKKECRKEKAWNDHYR